MTQDNTSAQAVAGVDDADKARSLALQSLRVVMRAAQRHSMQIEKHLRTARDQPDQRGVTLHLTDTGQAVIAAAPQPARGLLPSALGRLDAASLAQLNSGLAALLAVVAPDDRQAGLQPLAFTM